MLNDEVKRNLPDADIQFKPDRELTQIARRWSQYVDETNALREWGWKTEYFLKETVQDFVKEDQTHPGIYG